MKVNEKSVMCNLRSYFCGHFTSYREVNVNSFALAGCHITLCACDFCLFFFLQEYFYTSVCVCVCVCVRARACVCACVGAF